MFRSQTNLVITGIWARQGRSEEVAFTRSSLSCSKQTICVMNNCVTRIVQSGYMYHSHLHMQNTLFCSKFSYERGENASMVKNFEKVRTVESDKEYKGVVKEKTIKQSAGDEYHSYNTYNNSEKWLLKGLVTIFIFYFRSALAGKCFYCLHRDLNIRNIIFASYPLKYENFRKSKGFFLAILSSKEDVEV